MSDDIGFGSIVFVPDGRCGSVIRMVQTHFAEVAFTSGAEVFKIGELKTGKLLNVRPEVAEFAELMESKLAANDANTERRDTSNPIGRIYWNPFNAML